MRKRAGIADPLAENAKQGDSVSDIEETKTEPSHPEREVASNEVHMGGILGAPLAATLIPERDTVGKNSIINGEMPTDKAIREALIKRLKSMKGESTEYKSESKEA